MNGWRVVYTRQAQKDAKKLAASGLKAKAEYLLGLLREDPFRNPPPFEKLVGDLAGAFSRRINVQHRLVYQVVAEARTVKVLRMWTRYGGPERPGRSPAASTHHSGTTPTFSSLRSCLRRWKAASKPPMRMT